MILAQEISSIPGYQRQVESRAPVLAQQLRIFALDPNALAVLPDRGFEEDVSICIDRVSCAAQERFGQASIGRKIGGACSVARDGFSRVSCDKEPFARLPFKLNHV